MIEYAERVSSTGVAVVAVAATLGAVVPPLILALLAGLAGGAGLGYALLRLRQARRLRADKQP